MRIKPIKLILFTTIIGLILALSGCGFHLRGSHNPYTLPFEAVIVLPDDPFDLLSKQLRYSLQAKKIKVVSVVSKATCAQLPKITILDHQFTERPFAYGPDGEIKCKTLTLEVQYQYEHYLNNQKKIKTPTIIVRRFWQIDLNQNLGDIAEKAIIEKEMILDVVQQLLEQLTV